MLYSLDKLTLILAACSVFSHAIITVFYRKKYIQMFMQNSAPSKTILIVDDDQFITIAYKAGLEHAGYSVLIAQDGEEGVQQMADALPDLVLLDIIMPKMDGFEVLQTVKSDAKLSQIPVVVFTNLSQKADEEKARNYGAIDFMTKADMSLNDILLRFERLFQDLETAATIAEQEAAVSPAEAQE